MYLQSNSQKIIRKIDKWLVFFYFFLIVFGWLNIYSVSHEKAFKQLIWIIFGFAFIPFVFILRPVDYKYYTFIFYILGIVSLIGVLFIGREINGAKSWYVFGPISFQPVELAKICTSITLASILGKPDHPIKEKKNLVLIILILGLPILLVLLQPDPGSVLVFFSFILVLYRVGLHLNFLVVSILLLGLFLLSINFSFWSLLIAFLIIFIFSIPFQKNLKSWILTMLVFLFSCAFIFISNLVFENLLKPHHKDRIEIIFQNEFDSKYRNNVGYNLLYSKTAIGSGGFLGKGYQKGTVTKGQFVPEQHTDYIFCTVGEEWGFLGSVSLIMIYLFFIGRIYQVAERQINLFSKLFGYCIGSILFFHFFINVGMVMGLVPTIGIPLPFFSYGGSSFWAFSILIFIFIRLDVSNKEI